VPRLLLPLRRFAFLVLVILTSGLVWLASWQISQSLLDFTVVKAGITLVYVPAGIRLVILLVSGAMGALGIMLAFPVALLQTFPDLGWDEILTYSLVAGWVPYAAVQVTCRAAGISRDLATLRSIHLPVLAAAASISGAIAYTAALAAFGRFSRENFLPDATAMAAGDFLGCFCVVVLTRLVIAWRRRMG
jgi:hypothetical protein